MKRSKPYFHFTDSAKRDIERCRLFLWRTPGGRPARRIREIMKEARRITSDPMLYPVESVHPMSLLEFRRKNVGRFAIIYAYIEPTAGTPGGVVSVRAIRHGAAEDVLFRVEEHRLCNAATPRTSGLYLRESPEPTGTTSTQTSPCSPQPPRSEEAAASPGAVAESSVSRQRQPIKTGSGAAPGPTRES